MRTLAGALFVLVCLFIAIPADAGCYRCNVLANGDLACASKSWGWAECETWANRYGKGCEASGDSCGSGGGLEVEEKVRLDGCPERERLVLVRAETPTQKRHEQVTLVAVAHD